MQNKVILLTEIISPYRIPVFNEIAQSLNNRFLVLFFGETEKRRQWKVCKEKIKFHYGILPNILFQKKGLTPYFLNPTILYRLIKYSPEIIILGGYHHPSDLLALLYAKFFKKKIILWCESNKYDWRWNYPLKDYYKKWFIRSCTGYIVPGEASYGYLIALGAQDKKIYLAPNAVDNDYFTWASNKHRQTKEEFKQAKGYPKKLILYVGRLIDQKGILDLLKAFQMISSEDCESGLLLIGSAENWYKNFVKTNNIKNVFFEGFILQENLSAYYAASDVFVLPAHSDPWGLVLNEAMACGLPVISSNAAGAACDLIKQGENGYIFQKGNINQLNNYLRDILNDDQKRTSMGEESRKIIQNYSPLKCAQGVIRAIAAIQENPKNL